MRQLPRIGWLTVTGGALFLLSISGPAVALATPPARVTVTGETHAAVLSAAAPVTAGGWSDLATVDEVVFAIVGSGAVAGGAYAAVRSNRRGTNAEQAKAMHALNELIGALDSIAVMATVHPSTPTESVLLLRATTSLAELESFLDDPDDSSLMASLRAAVMKVLTARGGEAEIEQGVARVRHLGQSAAKRIRGEDIPAAA